MLSRTKTFILIGPTRRFVHKHRMIFITSLAHVPNGWSVNVPTELEVSSTTQTYTVHTHIQQTTSLTRITAHVYYYMFVVDTELDLDDIRN